MQHGVFMFPTHDAIDPGSLARLAEEYGFESLFIPEHSHIPASRLTPFPLGGELGREYADTLELFVALSVAAVTTSRLLIGSGICLVVQRDPIYCAKQVASIDHLSGGRFLFGVGAGWNVEEMTNHGTDPGTRFALLRDRVEAMRAIWTEDEASYQGRFVRFDAIWSWPKPIQEPWPPVLLAGNGPGVIDRVLAYGDGWLPNAEPDLHVRIAELASRAAQLGRQIPVTVYGVPPKAGEITRYAEAGTARSVYRLPSARRDEVEATMGAIVLAIEESRT